jgi:hypothetical protein
LTDDGDFFVCPHCGADVPARARFCRHCGASDDSGWNDGEADDGLSAADAEDDFDYDDYLRREFPDHAPPDPQRSLRKALVTFVVLAVALAMLLWSLGVW